MFRVVHLLFAALTIASLIGSLALAGDYYSTVPFLPTVKIGPDSKGATPVDRVYGKEYSHTDWMAVPDPRLTNVDDHNAFGMSDPLQVVSWDGLPGPIGGNSGSVDAFDYGVPGFNFPDGQVDALANHLDFLFRQVTRNEATLLFSVTTDLFGPTGPMGLGPGARVHWEDSTSIHAPWALIETPLGPGPGINHHEVKELDALEVWGPEPPSHNPDNPTPVREGYIGGLGGANTADADRFSLDLDAASGTSVWAYGITTGAVSPWIAHSAIVTAVETLFLGDDSRFDDETRRQIDVDATMARDLGEVGFWDKGDELLFSIDPIDMPFIIGPTGGPVPSPVIIDGGEIMHLVNTGGGAFSISFLFHGGHLWDTAFPVAMHFGYREEDIDGLEAVGALEGPTDIDTPEPGSLLLMIIALVVTLWRYR